MCDNTFSGEMKCIFLHMPDRVPMTDQSADTAKDQLSEPMSFIGITWRDMGER